MSTLTDPFTSFTTQAQDAVRSWTKLPDAHVVVDRYFDLAQQVLDGQRAVATAVLDAGTKAAGSGNVADTVTSKVADDASRKPSSSPES